MFRKEGAKSQRVLVDRISELPEFILHMILSFLDTKEACRASVLSKMWYNAWCSIPVLDFRPKYFGCYDQQLYDDNDDGYDGFVQMFVGFIDKVMQRYFDENISIKKLHLEFPKIDEKLEPFADKWILIAVKNQVQELNVYIRGSSGYRLPEILFSAKSLRILSCENVNLPYYKTMTLTSLDSLTLYPKNVDEDMLQRIISSCPLISLDIKKSGLQQMTLPWIGKARTNGKASSLRKFVFHGFYDDTLWQWNINVGVLRNLRKVEIIGALITDDAVSRLAFGLVALESLTLNSCVELSCIKISSISLKEFHIIETPDLRNATIDAPNLVDFWCNCQVEAAISISLINAQELCNVQFCPWLELVNTNTFSFPELKMFLMETNIFKVLVLDFSNCSSVEIEAKEEFLKNISSSPPYKLRELKLLDTRALVNGESTLSDFLDSLFWCFHPDVLSITTSFQNVTVEMTLNILKKNVECWRHPLKSIEVEGADLSSLLSTPSKLDIRFRLYWQ